MVVKARRWVGAIDEWVVVEEVVRAVALAEQLTDATPGQLLFGHFQGFNSNGAMEDRLRRRVASPAGQRLALDPIPTSRSTPAACGGHSRSMAARPGGRYDGGRWRLPSCRLCR